MLNKTNKTRLYIGTSGWHYESWVGNFYPKNINKNQWLEYYSGFFDTVEVNSSFYHHIKEEVFENWFRHTPDDFRFCIKAPRYITHIKRLIGCSEPFKKMLDSASKLGYKLGLFLFQLPPNLKKDSERLKRFLSSLPGNYRYVFEFRDESWFSYEIYKILDAYNAAIVISDSPMFPYHEITTGGISYIRMHGRGELYSSKYFKEDLERIACLIKKNIDSGITTHVYFNNDAFGNAVKDATELKGIMENI